MANTYRWPEIAGRLDGLDPASDGNTQAIRGTLTLSDGARVFVKIGVDDDTSEWANKEIHTYRFLESVGYPYIPKLLAVNDEQTGFAIEALEGDQGWQWSHQWSAAKADRVLAAMDALASIRPTGTAMELFAATLMDRQFDTNDWAELADSPDRQRALAVKLHSFGYAAIASELDYSAAAERNSRFTVSPDVLVHYDVRSDNCAWQPHTHDMKLVDWNWTQFGDRRIDVASVLVDIHKAGVGVLPRHAARLDPEALHWLTGFWFRRTINPMPPGVTTNLRTQQLHSGVVAYTLARELSS